ncbi:MAG: hypothetical protein H6658_12605 [Ardenticatenaceae bacterium]|nr:hypothetical protein [Ardenticatenaceae bacterium]
MKKLFLLLFLLLVACANPEAIETAVQQTLAAQTPVVEQVEATVIMEVPVTVEVVVTEAVIQEVEVTREVVVEVEVAVEVTRIVEQVVTATPEPTEPPTAVPTAVPTNTPAPQTANPQPTTPPVSSIEEQVVTAMRLTHDRMLSFGGMIDTALGMGFIDCNEVVNTYDAIVLAPTFDVSGTSQLIQYGYGAYREAIQVFSVGAWDMTQNCRDFLANPGGGGIPSQQWGAARQNVNNATDILSPALDAVESGG